MQIRSYPKQELAQLYFPGALPHSAVNRLTSWIRRCQPLSDRLAACNMSKHSKFYSARQVALIVEYLGEP